MKYFDQKQKYGLIIFIAIFLWGALASCSKVSTAIVDSPVTSIRVVMDNNYPPYIFLDEQGDAKGILVDQWALWEKRTGVTVELSAIAWEDALIGMKEGKFDVIDTIFYTDERAKVYNFTNSYAQIDVPIFFHNNISGIADAEDLRGFRVAVKSGDADAEYLINAGIKNLVYYNSYEEIIQAAERNEETIFVIDEPPGLYFLYKYGLQNQFNYSAPLFSGEFHRAVKKGDSALLDLVVSGFASISESEYHAIDNRWFGIEQGNRWQEYLSYLLIGTLIVLLIIFILLIFNRALQKRVSQRTQELKQALSNLQKSEREYREIFNATTEAIFIHAVPDGKLLHVNESMLQMYGYESEEDVLSGNIGDLSVNEPPYTQLDTQEKMRKALEEGPQVFEWLAKKKTGESFWTEVSLRNSQIVGENQILAVVRDITGRKQAEAALRKNDQRLQVFFNQSLDGFFFCDFEEPWEWKNAKNKEDVLEYIITTQRFTDANDAMLKQYGVSREKFLSLTTRDVFAHDIEQGRKMRRELFDKGRLHLDTYERTSDGATVWFEGEYFCLYDEQERINGFFGLQRDITERKQAEEAVNQRLTEQTILHRASQSLLAVHLDPEMIYATLHQAVVQIMPCEVFNIILDDKSGGDYHAVYLYDAGQRYPARRIPRGQGLSGKVISNGETLFIHDNLLENVPAVRFGSPQSVRSILAVPLRKNNESVGMVSAQSYQPNAYNERHRVLLETLAAQITTVIENAHLFEAERKQRQMSDALRDALSAGASMSVSLNFETILDHLLETLERVVPFDGGTIMLVQPQKQKISIAKMRGYKKLGKQLIDKISKFNFDILSVENLRWLLNNKQPLVISDVKQYPGWIHVPESSFTRSWVGAPIIVNNEVIALFSLDSTEPNFFTNEHAELLRAFTGQASLALQNARLFDETTQRALEFVSLYETSNALSAENELDGMLQVIVEHAKKLLGSASSGMYLYLPETAELELTVETAHYTLLGMRLQLNEGVAGRVAQTHRPFRVDDYLTWEGRSTVYDDASIRAVLGVPMLYGGELIGVLTADEIGDSERKFTEADERMLSLFASQAAGAIHSARLREQTARRLNQLQSLHTIDRAISSSFNLRPILNTVISQTIAQLGVDAVDVLLFHPHLQTLEYVAGQGFRTRAIERTQLRLGECFAGCAAFERRTIHVPNLPETGSNFTRASILEGESFLEYYGVPLIAKGEIKGVLEVFHRASLPHNPEWLDFLETLAGQAAITINQTQLFDDLQRANLELIIAYDATIEGWSHAMDLRDRETEGHTLRVTEMTLTLAKAMGISEKEMLHIKRGALLHDIGKMGVPDNILLKEGALTADEWAIMRQHPIFAYKMLQPIKYLRQSLDIPYCHHEKWDGTGYPRKLQGEQIPLVARIFSVIDVWDAVTIDRPYRKAWTKQKALKYIREQNGKHFDSGVVKIFLKLFDAK